MSRNASNIGSWAPAELAARAKSGSVALIPEASYLEWYGELPEARRREIETAWGPPPGKVMTTQSEDGTRMIVIPRLEIGNILIAPHPMWGYLEDEKVLQSKDALPPHHQYLAFFLWLRHEWKADAWVSLFSNIALQPGKSEGPLADDHIGLLLGELPAYSSGAPRRQWRRLQQAQGDGSRLWLVQYRDARRRRGRRPRAACAPPTL